MHREHGQGGTGRDAFGREQAGEERTASGRVETAEHGLDHDEAVERPDLPHAGESLDGEQHGRHGEAGTGEEHELPPVNGINDGTTEQTENDRRNGHGEPNGTDRQGGPGQREDLQGNGEVGHLVADTGQATADPEPPKRRRLPQRPNVHEQALSHHEATVTVLLY